MSAPVRVSWSGSAGGGRWLWSASLLSFVVAALGGVLYRASLLEGPPWGLQLGHLRHAHSHLMLLGWATPALLLLLREVGVACSGRAAPRALQGWAWMALLLSWATFPVFLMHGYDKVDIAGRLVPLGAILSGLGVFAWYGWGLTWWRWLRGVERSAALRLGDLALGLLALASLGGWGQMFIVMRHVEAPFWKSATIHLFVDLFAEGWVVAGALAGLWAVLRPGEGARRGGLLALALTMPPLFLLAVPAELVPWGGRAVGSVAGLGAAAALGWHVARLWPRARGSWALLRWPLGALGLHAAALGALAVPPLAALGDALSLRVLYLHVIFIGFFTPIVVLFAQREGGPQRGERQATLLGCGVLLGTLLPLTGLWPAAWSGRWALWAALGGASFLTVILAGVLARSWGAQGEGVSGSGVRRPR